jgi:hypothetical protein
MAVGSTLLAFLVSLALMGLAGLHIYWGVGGFWPGTDETSLVEHVVGRTPDMKAPSFVACISVATALIAVVGIIMLRLNGGWVPYPWSFVPSIGLFVAAAVFVLRGVAGFAPPVTDYAKGTPFYDLNLILYSPLCIVIGAALIALNLMLTSIKSGA